MRFILKLIIKKRFAIFLHFYKVFVPINHKILFDKLKFQCNSISLICLYLTDPTKKWKYKKIVVLLMENSVEWKESYFNSFKSLIKL